MQPIIIKSNSFLHTLARFGNKNMGYRDETDTCTYIRSILFGTVLAIIALLAIIIVFTVIVISPLVAIYAIISYGLLQDFTPLMGSFMGSMASLGMACITLYIIGGVIGGVVSGLIKLFKGIIKVSFKTLEDKPVSKLYSSWKNKFCARIKIE